MQHLQSVCNSLALTELLLTVNRFKTTVDLRFITEELAFDGDRDAAQFIVDYQGQHLIEDRGGKLVFLTGKAGNIFEGPRIAAFGKVDLKGQI